MTRPKLSQPSPIQAMPSPAPIALFAFKRPSHTRRTLEALALNPEFARSLLHVYCDGARHAGEAHAVEETRRIVQAWPHPAKIVHLAETNRGLARSVIHGVSELCASHGRVIVVEDDLIVSPNFLGFLNAALDHYADDARVMQVSGHMFPVNLHHAQADAVFLPFTTSWGWATWQRAWRHFRADMHGHEVLSGDRKLRRRFNIDNSYPYFAMLKHQRQGRIDSWAIRWHLSVFLNEGLTLYPVRSLVANEGFDGSGTHCGTDQLAGAIATWDRSSVDWNLPPVKTDPASVRAVADHLRSHHSLWQRARRYLRTRLN